MLVFSVDEIIYGNPLIYIPAGRLQPRRLLNIKVDCLGQLFAHLVQLLVIYVLISQSCWNPKYMCMQAQLLHLYSQTSMQWYRVLQISTSLIDTCALPLAAVHNTHTSYVYILEVQLYCPSQHFRSMRHCVFSIWALSGAMAQWTGKGEGITNMRQYTPPEQAPSPAIDTAQQVACCRLWYISFAFPFEHFFLAEGAEVPPKPHFN